jgi:phosphoglycerol transferase MdoB-like AlkP superfamily enzyme
MELTDNDVKAISEVRFKLHKELTWKRKYTIPMYSAMTVGAVLALFLGSFARSIQSYVAIFDISLWIFAYIVYLNWRNHVKRHWIAKFLQYYQEHKEFME